MKSLETLLEKRLMLQCLKCNTIYRVQLVKFRLQFNWRTYERCSICGKWAWHKDAPSQVKKSDTKE